MTACKSCGADAPGIACEFCGAVQRQPQDLADEMQALDAIAKAAQKTAEQGATRASFGQTAESASKAAMATFWSAAFMPTSPDALVHAASLAIAGMQPRKAVVDVGHDQLNEALAARARAAASALALRAASDPRAKQIQDDIAAAEARVKERSFDMEAVHRQNWKVLGIMGGVIAIGLLIFVPFRLHQMNQAKEEQEARANQRQAEMERKYDEQLPLATVPETMRGYWRASPKKELLITDGKIALTKTNESVQCEKRTRGESEEPSTCSGDGATTFKFEGWSFKKGCIVNVTIQSDGRLGVTGNAEARQGAPDGVDCSAFNDTYTKVKN